MVNNLIELLGISFLVLAAFLAHPVLGFVVAGIALVAVANIREFRNQSAKAKEVRS